MKSVQIDRFRFGSIRFFMTKTVQSGLARFLWFFLFDSGFSV